MKKLVLISILVIVLLVSISAQEPPCSLGIVSYLQFNEGTGTTAADSYGSNNAIINGATWVTGIAGSALSFDGIDDYVNIPYDISFNLSSFTLQAWVRFPQNHSDGYIISRANDGLPAFGYSFLRMSTSNGKIVVGVQGESYLGSVSTSTVGLDIADDQWHLATFVRNVVADEIKIYIDGAHYVSYSNSAPGDMAHNYQDFVIGSNNGASPFYSGLIDEVAIYDRVLSAAEILEHYNNGIGGSGYCEVVCTPETEICDGIDNDCDGQVDEDDVCVIVELPVIPFCQCGETWSNDILGETGTICSIGTILTSLTMMLSIDDVNITPGVLNNFLMNNGGYIGNNLLWAKINEYPDSDFIYVGKNYNISAAKLKQELDDGHPVVGSLVSEFFTVYGYENDGSALADFLYYSPGTSCLSSQNLDSQMSIQYWALYYRASEIDSDGDGYTLDVDCDDGDPNINPGATEICDGLDNDCDGQIDEGCPTCDDGIQNQDETDIDCGGVCGATCLGYKACLIDDDCFSDFCADELCAYYFDETEFNGDPSNADWFAVMPTVYFSSLSASDVDWYYFHGNEGDVINVEFIINSPNVTLCLYNNSEASDPNPVPIMCQDNIIEDIVLPVDDYYYVEVFNIDQLDIGDYVLRFYYSPPPVEIDSCTVINSPGLYTVTADIVDSDAWVCVHINSSDVVLDGQGHTIDGLNYAAGGSGVYANSVNDVTVKNLVLSDWSYAVNFENVTYGNIENNEISHTIRGIRLNWQCNNNNIVQNIITSASFAIDVYEANNVVIDDNYVSNSEWGVWFINEAEDSFNNIITNNDFSSNTDGGMYLGRVYDSVIADNIIALNLIDGIVFQKGANNLIYNNYFRNANHNLRFNVLTEPNFLNTSLQSGVNIVGGSFIGGNYWSKTDGTGFSDTCTDADTDGICDSSYTVDTGNTDYLPLKKQAEPGDVSDCMVIDSPGVYTLTNNIVDSGASVCIKITSSDVVFDGNGYTIDGMDYSYAYGVQVDHSTQTLTNVIVINLELTDWYYGIYYNAEQSSLEDSSLSSNEYGVYIYDSEGIGILNNDISSNEYGIFNSLRTYEDENGTPYFNPNAGNTISNNIINQNSYGIALEHTNDNTIITNTVTLNDFGIFLQNTIDNNIYNNFFNNTNSVYFIEYIYRNNWNIPKQLETNIIGGLYLGGNYWAEPDGTGFSETCLDILPYDGICDSSYTVVFSVLYNNTDYIDLSLYDYLPLTTVNITTDTDNDGISDYLDNCRFVFNDQTNSDSDLFGDACDNCWFVDNNDQLEIFGSDCPAMPFASDPECGAICKPIECGDTLYHSRELTEDLIGCDLGIILAAEDITLDCQKNNIIGTGAGTGVSVFAQNITVKNCVVKDFHTGIRLQFTDHSDIINNSVIDNHYGFALYEPSDNNVLTSNTARNNTDYGFYMDSSTGNTLTSNTANGGDVGFYMHLSSNNELTKNNADDNYVNGFYLLDSDNNSLTYNTANYIYFYAINLVSSNYNVLKNNTANNNVGFGFSLLFSTHNTIMSNTVQNNTNVGFDLQNNSTDNIIMSNIIERNGKGINLMQSDNNLIYNNYFKNVNNADDNGINFWNINKTPGTNIIGKDFLGGNFWHDYTGVDDGSGTGVHSIADDGLGDTSLPYNSDDQISNGGDNLPLFGPTWVVESCLDYLTSPGTWILTQDLISDGFCLKFLNDDIVLDCQGHSIVGSGYGAGIFADGLKNITVKNCTVEDFDFGISLISTYQSTLIDNRVENNYNGIYLEDVSESTLIDNVAESNEHYGYYMVASSFNTITSNEAYHNSRGFFLEGSSDNTLDSNIAWYNYRGIRLDSSENNYLVKNTANYNNWTGYFLHGSYNTVINNSAQLNGHSGFVFGSADDNVIIGNTAFDHEYSGFSISVNNSLILNNLASNNKDGFSVGGSYNNVVLNRAYNNLEAGFKLSGSHNTYENNEAEHNNDGFYLGHSSEDDFISNIVRDNYNGFDMRYSSDNIFESNLVDSNDEFGFHLLRATDNRFSSNLITENRIGLYLDYNSTDNDMDNNTIMNNINSGVNFIRGSISSVLDDNVICYNGVRDISSDPGNFGRDNICDTSSVFDDWNDLGAYGCTYVCPSCSNGIWDQTFASNRLGVTTEDGVDCGGDCSNQDCCENSFTDLNLNELGQDCGGPCDSCPNCIPLLYHGNPADKINMIFVPDGNDYQNDMDTFRNHTLNVIENSFRRVNIVNRNIENINFYYVERFGGEVTVDADGGCDWEFPSGWKTDCPFATVGAIVHEDAAGPNVNECRDYALGDKFSSEPGMFRTFLHEFSHAVFGLADEYDDFNNGCGTSYSTTGPFRNIWDSEEVCEDEATDPTNCWQFTTCDGGHWKSDPDGDIMECGGRFVCDYGPDGYLNVGHVFSQYIDPPPNETEKAIVVYFNSNEGVITHTNTSIVYGQAPQRVLDWNFIDINAFSSDGSVISNFSIRDPTYKHDLEFGPSGHIDNVDFDIVIPFNVSPRIVQISNATSGELLIEADLGEEVVEFCDAHPDDPDCLVADMDDDGVTDLEDNCPLDYNPDQSNADLDEFGDVCDICPLDMSNDVDFDGYCISDGDCDDNNAEINPSVEEVCDDIDNNCDGVVDEDLTRPTTCGLGVCSGNIGFETCTFGIWGGDTCNPLFGAVAELCDGLDNDCDGIVPLTEIDNDGDGMTECEGDCDDNDASINPGALEICDGIDNNCDLIIDDVDDDFDLVNDCFDDKCLVSVYWTAQELKPNHYDDTNWQASDINYGCTCEQVLFCKPGNNKGEYKFGCSEGTKDIWEAQSEESWALDCQVDGIVMEGIDKPFFENTDGDILWDIFDGDNDGDGIPDNQDDMIEDQDLPGDPDYGIPDWHPKSKHRK